MPDNPERHGVDSSRRKMLGLLGGSAAAGLAGCSALLGDDDDENGAENGDENGDENGGDSVSPPDGPNADKAQAAWERIEANSGPDAVDIQNQAYLEIEEAVRDDMIMLPLYHNLEERFWYDYVDVPASGALGAHHQQHTDTTVEGDDELNLINSTFSQLDPVTSTDTASGIVINQIYETLTHYPNGVAELENKLMESVDASEDGLTYTFTLKEGVEFHGGEELTADDVVYSWRRLSESSFSERQNFILGGGTFLTLEHERDDEGAVVPESPAIEAVDDYTVEIEIAEPNPGVLDIITYDGFAIVPEGIVGDIEGYDGEIDQDEFSTDMANGTGPFMYEEFTVGEEIELTAFDDYHDGAAEIDSIHWEINEDDEAAFTYAMEQNADIFAIPTAQYDNDLVDAEEDDRGRDIGTYGPVENDEIVNYLGVPELSTFYFAFNARHVPRPVRQAVAYVTDHEELIQEIFAGRGAEAFSFLPPALMPFDADEYNQWVDDWPYHANETDVPSARAVLENAGYSEDDPFEMTLTTYESEVFQEAAENIRDKLAGTPLDIDLEESPFNTLQERGEDGDLEMYSLGWIWSWEDPAYGHFGFEPKNTDTDLIPTDATGYYLDWQVDLEDEA